MKKEGPGSGNSKIDRSEINSVLQKYQAGLYREAEQLALSILSRSPKNPFVWRVLGGILRKMERFTTALKAVQKSIQLDPQDAAALTNLGNVLKDLGELEEAAAFYRKALLIKFKYAQAHNNLGLVLKETGRPDEALKSFKYAVEFKSNYPEAYNNLGNTFRNSGRFPEAEACYRQAILLKSNFSEFHNNLGVTLKEMGRLDEALECLQHSIAQNSEYAEPQINLGNVLKDLGKLLCSKIAYQRAIILRPDFATAYHNRGVAVRELGQLSEAAAGFRHAIIIEPRYAEAYLNLALMKKFTSMDEIYLKMQHLYNKKSISDEQRCHINFGLAKASEDLGNIKEAFRHYNEGNKVRKRLLNYDISHDILLFNQIKNNFQRIKEHALENISPPNNLTPIFIVGLPRSGTTLVEQVISSHSQVTGAGELSYVSRFGAKIGSGMVNCDRETIENFRSNYLDRLCKLSECNLFVTDKMPHNFRYLGLISAALPEAKIIHVQRNPAATCWANYQQYFASKTLKYCYDLDDVVQYFELYEKLMAFWKTNLGAKIYSLEYESLTINQEEETRNLINYLGLKWEDKLLTPEKNNRRVTTASNIQIRKKIYQGASDKWKKYKPFLGGALDHLEQRSGSITPPKT